MLEQPVTLGTFLRRRREETAPEQVGLRSIGRRRTPGLRREELALLAGISVDYLVRLEQNRDRRPSAAVLAALSDALHLDERERARLFRLATIDDRRAMCSAASPGSVRPSTRRLLDDLRTTPACLLEPGGDLSAWNPAFTAVMQATGLLDTTPPNLVRHVFEARARVLYPGWETVAAALVSHLQATIASCGDNRSAERVIQDLGAASPEFERLWERHETLELAGLDLVVAHPGGGTLAFSVDLLTLADGADRWLTALVPADDTTAGRVARLVGHAATPAPREKVKVAVAVPG